MALFPPLGESELKKINAEDIYVTFKVVSEDSSAGRGWGRQPRFPHQGKKMEIKTLELTSRTYFSGLK